LLIFSSNTPNTTKQCRTAITVLSIYINVCLNVMFDSLSYSFTSISFLTIWLSNPLTLRIPNEVYSRNKYERTKLDTYVVIINSPHSLWLIFNIQQPVLISFNSWRSHFVTNITTVIKLLNSKLWKLQCIFAILKVVIW
jgi:hypothetical protein